MWFFLKRLRHRTVIRRKLKGLIKLDKYNVFKKCFRLYKREFDKRNQVNDFKYLKACDHYDRSVKLRKRVYYLRLWRDFTRIELEFQSIIQSLRTTLNHRNAGICFWAIYSEYRHQHINDDEAALSRKQFRRFKIYQAIRTWRNRLNIVQRMRSYPNVVHDRRMLQIIQSVSNNESSWPSGKVLTIFTIQQCLRRALHRLKQYASTPRVFFAKSDALMYRALSGGLILDVASHLLSGTQVHQAIIDTNRALREVCERLSCRKDKSKLYNRHEGYLLGEINGVLNESSEIMINVFHNSTYVNTHMSTLYASLNSTESFDEKVGLLREHRMRVNARARLATCTQNEEPTVCVDSKGFAVLRPISHFVANTLENETLNFVFLYQGGHNYLPLYNSEIRNCDGRVLNGCSVVNDLSLILYGSIGPVFLKRWILRTRIKARLRTMHASISKHRNRQVIVSAFNNWSRLFELFHFVRRKLFARTLWKVRKFCRERMHQENIIDKAIHRYLLSWFGRYYKRYIHLRTMRMVEQEARFSTKSSLEMARQLGQERSLLYLRRHAHQRKAIKRILDNYLTPLNKRRQNTFFVEMWRRLRRNYAASMVQNGVRKRFLILWKWSIVEKIVLDRRHFRLWISAYNWRITKRAIQKVYEKKLKQAINVWLYHVKDFENKIFLISTRNRMSILANTLRSWKSLRTALILEYKSSRIRVFQKLDYNRYLNKVRLCVSAQDQYEFSDIKYKFDDIIYTSTQLISSQQYKHGWNRYKRKLSQSSHVMKMLILRMGVISAVQDYRELFDSISELLPTMPDQNEVAMVKRLSQLSKMAITQPLTKNLFPKIDRFRDLTISTKCYQQFLRMYLLNLRSSVLRAKCKHMLHWWISLRHNSQSMKAFGDKHHWKFLQSNFFRHVSQMKETSRYYKTLYKLGLGYYGQFKCWQYLRHWFSYTSRRKMRKRKMYLAKSYKSEKEQMNFIQCLKIVTFD